MGGDTGIRFTIDRLRTILARFGQRVDVTVTVRPVRSHGQHAKM